MYLILGVLRSLVSLRLHAKQNRSSIIFSTFPYSTGKYGSEISRQADFGHLTPRSSSMTFKIMEKDPLQPNGPPQTSLIEIGPRFVLTPIRIFEGAFGGATVFSNPGERSYLSRRFKALNFARRICFTRCCSASG